MAQGANSLQKQKHKKEKCLMHVIKIRSVDILIRRNGYITEWKYRIEPRTQGGAGAKFLRMEAQLVRNTHNQKKQKNPMTNLFLNS